eukprot:jgi/Mesvir1/7962/Mv11874-RA.1
MKIDLPIALSSRLYTAAAVGILAVLLSLPPLLVFGILLGILTTCAIEVLGLLFVAQKLAKPPASTGTSEPRGQDQGQDASLAGAEPATDGSGIAKAPIERIGWLRVATASEFASSAGAHGQGPIGAQHRAALRGNLLILKDASGKRDAILLQGCQVVLWKSPFTGHPWARKFPIQVSHPAREVLSGERACYLYPPNAADKEAWFVACRYAAGQRLVFDQRLVSRVSPLPPLGGGDVSETGAVTSVAGKVPPSSGMLGSFLRGSTTLASSSNTSSNAGSGAMDAASGGPVIKDEFAAYMRAAYARLLAYASQEGGLGSSGRGGGSNGRGSRRSSDGSKHLPGQFDLRASRGASTHGDRGASSHNGADATPIKSPRKTWLIGPGGAAFSDLHWLNLIMARVFYDMRSNGAVLARYRGKVQGLLDRAGFPSFLALPKCTSIDFGSHPPTILAVRPLPPEAAGDVLWEMDIEWYSGGCGRPGVAGSGIPLADDPAMTTTTSNPGPAGPSGPSAVGGSSASSSSTTWVPVPALCASMTMTSSLELTEWGRRAQQKEKGLDGGGGSSKVVGENATGADAGSNAVGGGGVGADGSMRSDMAAGRRPRDGAESAPGDLDEGEESMLEDVVGEAAESLLDPADASIKEVAVPGEARPGGNWIRSAGTRRLKQLRGLVQKVCARLPMIPLQLTLRLEMLRGTVRLRLGPPPSNRIWWGFVGGPELKLGADPMVGERRFRRVGYFIIDKVQAEICKTLTWPMGEDIKLVLLRGAEDEALWQSPGGQPPGPSQPPPLSQSSLSLSTTDGSRAGGGISGTNISSSMAAGSVPTSASNSSTANVASAAGVPSSAAATTGTADQAGPPKSRRGSLSKTNPGPIILGGELTPASVGTVMVPPGPGGGADAPHKSGGGVVAGSLSGSSGGAPVTAASVNYSSAAGAPRIVAASSANAAGAGSNSTNPSNVGSTSITGGRSFMDMDSWGLRGRRYSFDDDDIEFEEGNDAAGGGHDAMGLVPSGGVLGAAHGRGGHDAGASSAESGPLPGYGSAPGGPSAQRHMAEGGSFKSAMAAELAAAGNPQGRDPGSGGATAGIPASSSWPPGAPGGGPGGNSKGGRSASELVPSGGDAGQGGAGAMGGVVAGMDPHAHDNSAAARGGGTTRGAATGVGAASPVPASKAAQARGGADAGGKAGAIVGALGGADAAAAAGGKRPGRWDTWKAFVGGTVAAVAAAPKQEIKAHRERKHAKEVAAREAALRAHLDPHTVSPSRPVPINRPPHSDSTPVPHNRAHSPLDQEHAGALPHPGEAVAATGSGVAPGISTSNGGGMNTGGSGALGILGSSPLSQWGASLRRSLTLERDGGGAAGRRDSLDRTGGGSNSASSNNAGGSLVQFARALASRPSRGSMESIVSPDLSALSSSPSTAEAQGGIILAPVAGVIATGPAGGGGIPAIAGMSASAVPFSREHAQPPAVGQSPHGSGAGHPHGHAMSQHHGRGKGAESAGGPDARGGEGGGGSINAGSERGHSHAESSVSSHHHGDTQPLHPQQHHKQLSPLSSHPQPASHSQPSLSHSPPPSHPQPPKQQRSPSNMASSLAHDAQAQAAAVADGIARYKQHMVAELGAQKQRMASLGRDTRRVLRNLGGGGGGGGSANASNANAVSSGTPGTSTNNNHYNDDGMGGYNNAGGTGDDASVDASGVTATDPVAGCRAGGELSGVPHASAQQVSLATHAASVDASGENDQPHTPVGSRPHAHHVSLPSHDHGLASPPSHAAHGIASLSHAHGSTSPSGETSPLAQQLQQHGRHHHPPHSQAGHHHTHGHHGHGHSHHSLHASGSSHMGMGTPYGSSGALAPSGSGGTPAPHSPLTGSRSSPNIPAQVGSRTSPNMGPRTSPNTGPRTSPNTGPRTSPSMGASGTPAKASKGPSHSPQGPAALLDPLTGSLAVTLAGSSPGAGDTVHGVADSSFLPPLSLPLSGSQASFASASSLSLMGSSGVVGSASMLAGVAVPPGMTAAGFMAGDAGPADGDVAVSLSAFMPRMDATPAVAHWKDGSPLSAQSGAFAQLMETSLPSPPEDASTMMSPTMWPTGTTSSPALNTAPFSPASLASGELLDSSSGSMGPIRVSETGSAAARDFTGGPRGAGYASMSGPSDYVVSGLVSPEAVVGGTRGRGRGDEGLVDGMADDVVLFGGTSSPPPPAGCLRMDSGGILGDASYESRVDSQGLESALPIDLVQREREQHGTRDQHEQREAREEGRQKQEQQQQRRQQQQQEGQRGEDSVMIADSVVTADGSEWTSVPLDNDPPERPLDDGAIPLSTVTDASNSLGAAESGALHARGGQASLPLSSHPGACPTSSAADSLSLLLQQQVPQQVTQGGLQQVDFATSAGGLPSHGPQAKGLSPADARMSGDASAAASLALASPGAISMPLMTAADEWNHGLPPVTGSSQPQSATASSSPPAQAPRSSSSSSGASMPSLSSPTTTSLMPAPAVAPAAGPAPSTPAVIPRPRGRQSLERAISIGTTDVISAEALEAAAASLLLASSPVSLARETSDLSALMDGLACQVSPRLMGLLGRGQVGGVPGIALELPGELVVPLGLAHEGVVSGVWVGGATGGPLRLLEPGGALPLVPGEAVLSMADEGGNGRQSAPGGGG